MSSKKNDIFKITQQSKEIHHCRTFAQDRLKKFQAQLALEHQNKIRPLEPKFKQIALKVDVGEHKNDSQNCNKIPVKQQQKQNTESVKSKVITLNYPFKRNEKCGIKRPHSPSEAEYKNSKIARIQESIQIPFDQVIDHRKPSNNGLFENLRNRSNENKQNCSTNNSSLNIRAELPTLFNQTEKIINSKDNINTTTGTNCSQSENTDLVAEYKNNVIVKNKYQQIQPYNPMCRKDSTCEIQKIKFYPNKGGSSATECTDLFYCTPNSADKTIKNNINKNIKFDSIVQNETSTSTDSENSCVNNKNKIDHSTISIKLATQVQNKYRAIQKCSANNRLEKLKEKLRQANSLLSPNELENLTSRKHNSSNITSSSCETKTNENVTYKSTSPIKADPMHCNYIFEGENQSVNKRHDIKESTMSDFYDIVQKNLLRISAETTQTQSIIMDNNYLYFVVDTNILLNNLAFIDDLIKLNFCQTNGTIIFIPYIVLQELDKLKMRMKDSVSTLAARAIKYLNDKLESNWKSILGQSSLESNNNLIEIESPDDKIINCCLQLKLKKIHFVLLSNDINLRNKAILNHINVATKSDLVTKMLKEDSINIL